MELTELKKALNDFFKDTGRPQEHTLSGLKELEKEVDTMIDSLEEDMEEEEYDPEE
jgi:hypothetical protein